jgi:hypothetical protein
VKARVVSILIALLYAIAALITEGVATFIFVSMALLLPLAMIWFPGEIGDYIGFARLAGPRISKKSPGGLIAFFGWCFLLAPLVIFMIKIL